MTKSGTTLLGDGPNTDSRPVTPAMDQVLIFSLGSVQLTTHDEQCPNAAIDPELDIGVQVVPYHEGSFGIEIITTGADINFLSRRFDAERTQQ